MKAETLAWITDDEAEFWTAVSPIKKPNPSNHQSKSKDSSSDVILPDGLYFKYDNQFDTELEDRLSLLYRQTIENQKKDNEEYEEKKSESVIFEFEKNIHFSENIPGISMNFLDRLFHQITRPPPSDIDEFSDEEFSEIDPSEITTVINNNTDIDKSNNQQNKSNEDESLIDAIRTFLDDLYEETDVIRGTLDEETFINRRSRRAKSSIPSTGDNRVVIARSSI